MSLTTNEEALVRQLIEQNAELLNLATNEATIISKLAATKKNLGQLTSASSVADTDISFVRQGTADKSATLATLRGYMKPDQATETTTGVVELATTAEVQAGTDSVRAVTPAGLAAKTATETRAGIVELATVAEVQTGTDTTRAVTTAGLVGRTATETRAGIIELATAAEALEGTDTTRAVTPAGLNAASSAGQIQPISASVAGNALTVTLNATKLEFRSATLASGTINKRTVSSPVSLTISSGSTLGTISATAARIAVIAIDNAGTVELAVSNIAGGVNLDETTLISTTAEGGAGAADSATVIYSANARSNLPFRVVGFVDITEATAGIWSTGPTKVQGVGGQALAAMSSLGYGQTYQNVTAGRASGATYYNVTGKPIFISLTVSAAGGEAGFVVTVGGAMISSAYGGASGGHRVCAYFVVPAGASYSVTIVGTIYNWSELR